VILLLKLFKRKNSIKSKRIMMQALRLRRGQYYLASFFKNFKFLYPIFGAIFVFFTIDYESINHNVFIFWDQAVFVYWGRMFMVLMTSSCFLMFFHLEKNYYIERHLFVKSKVR